MEPQDKGTFRDFLSPDERIKWAWLAGIIDGEGSIRIEAPHRKDRPTKRFRLHLTIGMTHPATIEQIQKIAHCGSCYKRIHLNPRHKTCLTWRATDKQAAGVLRLCFPLLVTKREQARIALQFIELHTLSTQGRRLPPSIVARYEELAGALRALNRKGPHLA